jgi:hypothetical protein
MPLDTDLILDRIARRLVRLRAISLAHARLLAEIHYRAGVAR